MIEVTCDRCDRAIQFDDADAGQKRPCPHCGDINRLPDAPVGGAAAPKDRAEAAGLPPDHGPETQVVLVRPAMLRARPMSFLGLMVLTLGGLGSVIATPFGVGALFLWLGLPALAIGLGVLGVWKIMTFAAALEITNKRTIMRQGLFRRSTSEVLHDSIRNIQIDQSFWNRLWGVGRIGISSSGQDGIEIELGDLPRPDKIRETIDLYRPL